MAQYGAKQGAERFMAKWIAAAKVKAGGLRHAVVHPNVTGRTKDMIKASVFVLVRSPP